ncbi:MAG TPA: hypothetical protein VNT26_19215 [Candidatus Sulfotelmatobacter sp.]|nr:hypothetical protein [Candidatus Sulfotelmatobacter sp.]
MKTVLRSGLLGLVLVLGVRAPAQTYDTNNVAVQTFAGSGFYGYYDGQGIWTMFNAPAAVAADACGNLFVLDSGNSLIRKVTPDATVSTWFNFSAYSATGPMILDHSNTLWIAISYSSSVLRISSNGVMSLVTLPFSGFNAVGGLCVDSRNNLYVADAGGHKIYRLQANGVGEVFAGSGNPGAADGTWIFTSFNNPKALAADAADNIYVWDSANRLIRRISPSREVVTLAGNNNYYYGPDADGVGTNAFFNTVSAMAVDSGGNLLLACGLSVRKLTPTTNVLTLAGSFDQSGYTNGPGALARFRNAAGLCIAHGQVYVADIGDHRIREISWDAGAQPVSPANLALNTYPGLQLTGVVGRTYRIESSTNLTDWTTETTLLLTASPQVWIDANGLGQKKFYRAWLLP